MSKRKQVHVVPNKSRGGWDVKSSGAKRAGSHHQTKSQAVAKGKQQAKSSPKGQIVVHKKDGAIQTEHTYGDDPYPPKG